LLVLSIAYWAISAARRRRSERKLLDLRLGAERPPQLGVEYAGAAGALGAGAPAQLGEGGVPIAGALPAPAGVTVGAAEPEPGRTAAETQAEAERIRALTAEIATADPYLAARIVRTWLSENSNSEEAA